MPRTTQVDGQRGQDQARQCQECQQGQQQGVARAEAGAGAGWGHRAQGRQERRGHRGHGPRWGPAQAAGGSRAIACRQGREGVRAWPQAQLGLAQPPLQCSPSVPLCPPEAQYRSLMDSTGRRLMAPDSLLSGSAGSAGAAPSALPMLSAGAEAKGQPVPCPQPPPAPGTPVGPEPCQGDLSLGSPVLHQSRQPVLVFLWHSPAATVGKHWLCPPGPTAVIRAVSGCLVATIPEPC